MSEKARSLRSDRVSDPILTAADFVASVQLVTCRRRSGVPGCVVFTTMASSPVEMLQLRTRTSVDPSMSMPASTGCGLVAAQYSSHCASSLVRICSGRCSLRRCAIRLRVASRQTT